MNSLLSVVQIGSGWFPEHPGGLERVFYALWQHLPAEGFSVRGLVLGTSHVAAETGGTVHAVANHRAPLPCRWQGMRRHLQEIFRQTPPNLIAGHFALYLFPVRDLIKDYPFIMHFHGPWAEESRAESRMGGRHILKYHMEQMVYRRATHCVVLSTAFQELLHIRYGIPQERITVIPGGVDIERFALSQTPAEAREHLGLPRDRPILLTVRRLRQRMGLIELLEAVEHLREAFPELLVLIAGKGPLYDSLKARIAERQLEHQIHLLGFVPEEQLPLLYRAADLTLMPSQSLEGFGLVTLESLATGTPVLATPIGGLPEILHPLNPNLLTPDTSVEALTEHLRLWLLGRLSLPDATACQEYVRRQYTWQEMARKTAELYRSLV